MTRIMQGDEYPIYFAVTKDELPVNINEVEVVEVTIGNLKKKYPETITYDKTTGNFSIYLTQKETFGFSGEQEMKVRVKFVDNNVIGTDVVKIEVTPSTSKEIL